MNRSQATVLGVVFAATALTGVLTYKRLTTPFPRLPPPPAGASAPPARTPLFEEASKVANLFAGHVGAGRFGEAHALMAGAYRNAVPLDAFTKSCQGSPILAGARAVSLRQLRQENVGASATVEATGALDSSAGAVPATFVFLREPAGLRVLVLTLAGVPVLQGVVPGP